MNTVLLLFDLVWLQENVTRSFCIPHTNTHTSTIYLTTRIKFVGNLSPGPQQTHEGWHDKEITTFYF